MDIDATIPVDLESVSSNGRHEYDVIARSLTNRSGLQIPMFDGFQAGVIKNYPKILSKERGIQVAECIFPDADRDFLLPMWSPEQPRATFLPDLFKIARHTGCRVIVLFEGERMWIEHPPKLHLTLDDVTLDITAESECVDANGHCVLTWLRLAPKLSTLNSDIFSVENDVAGYRCAVLRMRSWFSGVAPQTQQLAALMALYYRFFSINLNSSI